MHAFGSSHVIAYMWRSEDSFLEPVLRLSTYGSALTLCVVLQEELWIISFCGIVLDARSTSETAKHQGPVPTASPLLLAKFDLSVV